MALPVIGALGLGGKAVGGAGLFAGGRAAATRYGSRISSGLSSAVSGITGTAAGGAAGGYGFAQAEQWIEDVTGHESSTRVLALFAAGLAVVYVLGQLFDVEVGS